MDIVREPRPNCRAWAAALLLGACAGALAQGTPYKVTGPDGRITYTDRPPANATSVRPLNALPASGGGGEADWLDGLPFTLRQTAARFPVTLYTAPGCAPCDLGRLALQQRGVPFQERRVEGADALQRREGTTSLPVLRVGSQQLLGFEAGEWRRTLDAAGYPASSALPPHWQAPPVQALKAREMAEGASQPARPAAPQPVPPVGEGFRF